MIDKDYKPIYHTESAVKLLRAVGDPEVGGADEPVSKISPMGIDVKLNILLDMISYREGKILEWRYGFMDGNACSLEEAGERFGSTRERARQLEAKAIRKVHRNVERLAQD
jgi:DNA-directed RNA polymerase sigma subunit (sigma70/sigma32)